MKNILIPAFCLIIFITCSLHSFSQKNFKPAYIITNNSDTILGFINATSNRLNSAKCIFKKDENAEANILYPNEIKSYSIENARHYVSKNLSIDGEEKQYFLENLVDGVVDLYYHNVGLIEYYYIEKNGEFMQLNNNKVEAHDKNGNIYICNTNQYKGALKSLFEDVPEIDNKIVNSKFTASSLIDITKEYNRLLCPNDSCIDYSKKIKKEIFCELLTGMDLSFMGLTSSKKYSRDIKPVFGINFRFNDNRFNSRFDFISGFSITQQSFSEVYDNTIYSKKLIFHVIDLEYTLLRVPLTLEYAFSSGKFQPVVSITYNNCFLINPEYSLQSRNYYTDNDYVTLDVESPLRKYNMGFELGVGFKYHLTTKSYLTCSLRGEYREPAANFNYVLDYLNNKSLLFRVAYGFKI